MSRTLYLHIGSHKTGTSAIQTACLMNLDKLRALGWDFALRPGRPVNWGDTIGFARLGAPPRFWIEDWGMARILQALQGTAGNVIFSAEDLFFLEESEVQRFARTIAKLFDEVVIIAYLRRQDELAVSQKTQGAKTLQSAVAFGLDHDPLPRLTPIVRSYLSFCAKLATWQRAFPGARLEVKEYRRAKLRKGDIVADFFGLLGLRLPWKVGEVNTSTGANTTKLLLTLRGQGIKQQEIHDILHAGWIEDDPTPHLPSETEARAFYAEFEQENAALGDLLGKPFAFHDDFSRYPPHAAETGYDDYERRNLFGLVRQLQSTTNAETAVKLRDMALAVEETHPRIALSLMSIAYDMRPHGEKIREHMTRMTALRKDAEARAGAAQATDR